MSPLGVMVGLATIALADPATDVLRQRQVVDDAVAEVARARAEGERRREAEAMRVYREAAIALERLVQTAGPPVEEIRRQRVAAITELTNALAEGSRESPAREVLAGWLGAAEPRAELLADALGAADLAPTEIRRGVLLDVLEQSDALAVLLLFDATEAELEEDQLMLRATSLRRRGPALTATMADEVEALRLEEQARAAEGRNEAWLTLRVRVLSLRRRALAALEGEER